MRRSRRRPSRRGPFDRTGTRCATAPTCVVRRRSDVPGPDRGASAGASSSERRPVDRAAAHAGARARGGCRASTRSFVAPVVEALPAVCRTFLDVDGRPRARHARYVRAAEGLPRDVVEGVSNEYDDVRQAARAGRRLEHGHRGLLRHPELSVFLLRLVGSETADGAPASRSSAGARTTRSSTAPARRCLGSRRPAGCGRIVGQGATDAMALDLRTQGPHALVGGTTGAGKSEFLQAWVLGMAAAHSPDRVTFLFVDYKGGSAFADCVELPHCVGLVTDLSPHLVRRALTSLRAELHHREHLFNRKKAKDLLELEKRPRPRDSARARARHRRVRRARGRGAGVRRRRRRHRPARPLARHPPHHGHAATGGRHQGQPARQHEPARRAADGGRVRLEGCRRRPDRRHASTRASPAAASPRPDPAASCRSSPRTRAAGAATRPGRRRRRSPSCASASTKRWEVDAEARDRRARRRPRARTTRSGSCATSSPRPPRPASRRRAGRGSTTSRPPSTCVSSRSAATRASCSARATSPSGSCRRPCTSSPTRDGPMLVYGTSGSGKSTVLRSIAIAAGARPDLGRATSTAPTSAQGRSRLESCRTSARSSPATTPSACSACCARSPRCSTTAASGSARPTPPASRSIEDHRARRGADHPAHRRLRHIQAEWETTTARMPFYQIFMRILGEGRPLGVHVVATADRSGSVPTAVSSNVSQAHRAAAVGRERLLASSALRRTC